MPVTLELTTPALLFPAISLLFLAYTNRFLVLAQLVRQLRQGLNGARHPIIAGQIRNLRLRLGLMKLMQILGVIAFLLCSSSMSAIFLHWPGSARWLFGASLASLTASLLVSLYEVFVSTGALELELSDLEQ
ncbi:MAG TPA: DUF2721 domain-containing protein [Polyangiaceae bacterium]|nr:DUF2721 domain-containing protein [Polyangiaceae bacterium]